jgi:hypothetical protein
MALDEDDYAVLADLAKSVKRIADVLDCDFFEDTLLTLTASLERIADALEGKDQ